MTFNKQQFYDIVENYMKDNYIEGVPIETLRLEAYKFALYILVDAAEYSRYCKYTAFYLEDLNNYLNS